MDSMGMVQRNGGIPQRIGRISRSDVSFLLPQSGTSLNLIFIALIVAPAKRDPANLRNGQRS
jgi:hypothetical protein